MMDTSTASVNSALQRARKIVACYVGADVASTHDAWSINVFTLRGDQICEITSFIGAEHFGPFGLPATR